MPSVETCPKPTDMTSITDSLEVFDTYKRSEEEKDSDDESFHLPLDDDESENKYEDNTNICDETEEEILNKFETNFDEPKGKSLQNGDNNKKAKKGTEKDEKKVKVSEEDEEKEAVKEKRTESEEEKPTTTEEEKPIEYKEEKIMDTEKEKPTEVAEETSTESAEEKSSESEEKVPKSEVEEKEAIAAKEEEDDEEETKIEENKNADTAGIIQTTEGKTEEKMEVDDSEEIITPKKKEAKDGTKKEEDEVMDVDKETDNVEVDNSSKSENGEKEVTDTKDETTKEDKPKNLDKCENSNDSEDLMDIAVIRDADEDNAENDAKQEEEEQEDGGAEENEETAENDEGTENDAQLPNGTASEEGDVEIEESNLGDEERTTANSNTSECTTEKTDKVSETSEVNNKDSVTVAEKEKETEEKDDVSSQKSLKRSLSDSEESTTIKKIRTEIKDNNTSVTECIEDKKLPIVVESLKCLSDFMNAKKSKKLTLYDLEEFCLQKICESILYKSELGEVNQQLKAQEQLVDSMRKELQQLTKQTRDLEIVNKKLINDLKSHTAGGKPLAPLKITRSVGLQVKFTPIHETTTVVVPKKKPQMLTPTKASPPLTKISPAFTQNKQTKPVVNGITTKQVNTPQKQQPKPQTALSQALTQPRVNSTPPQAATPIKPKPAETPKPSNSVIDLTDEDDKQPKKTIIATPQNRFIQRGTPSTVRTTVRNLQPGQNIRFATSTKTSINSGINTSTPQLMYVVQSGTQSGTPKAVVVNFQSANGVLSPGINGSIVQKSTGINGTMHSVLQKTTSNAILKTISTTSTKVTPQQNKIVQKPPNKHPAPLPAPPLVRVNTDKALKPIPPKPHLTIRKTDTGIILQWKMPYELDMYEVIASYQLYAYQETNAAPSTDMWRRVGDVKALALPMACTLTQFADKNKYYFAVRPVDVHKRIGAFSDPEEISL